MKNKIMDLHNKLLDDENFLHITSDTGDKEQGRVVITISCKKTDLIKKLGKIIIKYEKS